MFFLMPTATLNYLILAFVNILKLDQKNLVMLSQKNKLNSLDIENLKNRCNFNVKITKETENWLILQLEHQIMSPLRFKGKLAILKQLIGGQWESYYLKCLLDILHLPLKMLLKHGTKFKIGENI